MKVSPSFKLLLGTIMAAAFSHAGAAAFVSGSTGADGALAPTADTTIQLPASGVLHYTTVDIPAGVTVRFAKNTANTAVVLLTTGDVKIAGAIDISGGAAQVTKFGLAGDINKGGIGGPGGFDGARGGLQEQNRRGGTGYGPGGGGGGTQAAGYDYAFCSGYIQGGGGGGFSGAGESSVCIQNVGSYDVNHRTGFSGPTYGSNSMLPLVGGSGGGGGAGGPNGWSLPGSGGGGGGGALMLVAAGSVTLSGKISARGGNGGNINNNNCDPNNRDSGGAGGGGAGGAVRILTPSFNSSGSIDVSGGKGGCRLGNGTGLVWENYTNSGGHGGVGRSSVEIVSGGTFSLSVIPTLAITSIGGVPVPPNPTGAGDVTLPSDLPNPATVTVSATGIPVGTVVKLTLSQPYNVNVTANASALAGSLQGSTASGSINIPTGSSVIMASTTYALTMAQGEALSIYAQGERVEKVSLSAVLGGEQRATLITVSGKEYDVPAAVLALLPS